MLTNLSPEKGTLEKIDDNLYHFYYGEIPYKANTKISLEIEAGEGDKVEVTVGCLSCTNAYSRLQDSRVVLHIEYDSRNIGVFKKTVNLHLNKKVIKIKIQGIVVNK